MSNAPKLTIVVVLYQMEREAPRTLYSLSSQFQQGVNDSDYNVIVLDNGSPQRRSPDAITQFGPNFSYRYVENAGPSPGPAINAIIDESETELIGICYDGGRMLSPGVLNLALQSTTVHPDPFTVTLGFELGPDIQVRSQLDGYNADVEDRLLEQANWKNDGYRLFEISCLGESSGDGWLGSLSESSCFFMRRNSFQRLGGFHSGFTMGGGGMLNLDFYREACEDPQTQLVVLLGEANFHQVHGAVFNNATPQEHAAKLAEAHAMYERLRGRTYEVPQQSPLYLGQLGDYARRHLTTTGSADSAVQLFESLSGSTSLRFGSAIGRLIGCQPPDTGIPRTGAEAVSATAELLNSVPWELGAPCRLVRKLVDRVRNRRSGPTALASKANHPTIVDAVERPLFLIGTARSGTTWLAEELGEFSNVVYCPFELRRIWSTAGGVPMASPETGDRTNPALSADDVWEGQADSLKEAFRKRLCEELNGVVPDGSIQFLNKSPHLCNKLELVNALFPEARYIWLHRPMVSVVASLKAVFEDIDHRQNVKHYWPETDIARPQRYFHTIFDGLNRDRVGADRIFPGGDVAHLAEYWLESNLGVAEFFSDLPDGKGIVVSHESLLSHPDHEFSRLATFLDVGARTRISRSERRTDSLNLLWQQRLSPDEVTRLHEFCGRNESDTAALPTGMSTGLETETQSRNNSAA